MTSVINGNLLLPGSAHAYPATAQLSGDGRLVLSVTSEPELSRRARADDYTFGPTILGLAVEVLFNDGAVFTPDDNRHRWKSERTSNQGFISFLEKNLVIVLIATVITPIAFWWIATVAAPGAVERTVVLLPQEVSNRMGKETLYLLEKLYLDESELDEKEKFAVEQLWQNALSELAIPSEQYQLHFRHAEKIGANAFALPDGSVIVTDDIVRLLADDPNAMLAVLLHEIGHVEHKHSLRLIGRSLSTTIIFAVFFGDIEGVGELVIGASSALLDFSFSRNMETDADEFSFTQLEKLGVSPAAFADAMEALMASANSKKLATEQEPSANEQPSAKEPSMEKEHALRDEVEQWARYLSTHPMMQERIQAARARGEDFSNRQ